VARDDIESTADLFGDQLLEMLGKRLHIQVEVERTDSGMAVLVRLVDRKTKKMIVQGQGMTSRVGEG
jgi:hypothetical protein